MCEFAAELKRLFAQCGYPLSEGQCAQMQAYYDCLLEENKKYNLTAITQPGDAALKHFLDSAVPYAQFAQSAKLIDIGSGAGFPAVPLKIMRPDVQVTALEATQKKAAFIRLAAQQAGIELCVLQARAEDAARSEHRGVYDACTSRAVADLPVLMELCAGFLRPGGQLFAYKGGTAEEEMRRSQKAMAALGLKFQKKLDLPLCEYGHCVLVYQKTNPLPDQYPRNYAQIRKKPL